MEKSPKTSSGIFPRPTGEVPPKAAEWGLLSFLLPILSGLLLALSFPKFDQSWLAWFALIPLLVTLLPAGGGEKVAEGRMRDIGRQFTKGFLCGLSFYLVLLYWIYLTCRYGNVPVPMAAGATLALASLLALLFGVFAVVVSSPIQDDTLWPLFAAATWVSLEFFRERVMGFPWELIGYSQWQHPVLLHITSITGIHGLSFLIVWINASLAMRIAQEFPSPGTGEDGRRPGEGQRKALILPAVVLMAVVAVGARNLTQSPSPQNPAPPLRVSILQGNIDQYKKWDAAYVAEIKSVYEGLAPYGVNPPDLIVWPESSVPGFLDEPGVPEWISSVVRRSAATNLVGVIARQPGGVANSAVVVFSNGQIGARYDKRHLVPFGEYVPLQDFLGRWAPILTELGGVVAGKDPSPLYHPARGVRLGASVCYEIVFPHEVRQEVAAGATVLVNLTNDGWYLNTAGPYQHLSMAVVRAAENHRPIVRAANTGISAIIDATGRVVDSLPIDARGVLNGTVTPAEDQTFFTRHGELFAWLCVLFALAYFAYERFLLK